MPKSTWSYILHKRSLLNGCLKSYARKTSRQRNKKEVRHVMEDIDNVIDKINDEIKNGTYQVGPYRHYVLEDRKKSRNISVLPFVDRCVQNMLKDAIEPILVNQMLDVQTAGIPHRGIASKTKRWNTIKQMREAVMNRRHKYCVLLDIHHCYDSINNIVVIKLLEKRIHDKRTLAILRKHVFAQQFLAIGDPISHLYCNLVVANIIRPIQEQTNVDVVNFADNIALFGETLEDVKKGAKQIKSNAAKYRLTLNKAYPFAIDNLPHIVWCGRKFFRNGKVLLRNDTKKRYIAARHKKRSLPSYQGILQSCNCKNLKKTVEIENNKTMRKQRTPFAGKAVKADNIVGIKHTIVKTDKKISKQKDSEFYFDVQAITETRELIRYTTSSKLLVQALSAEEIPIRDVVIKKDWRGFYYDGSVYSNEEEAEIICKEFGIDY